MATQDDILAQVQGINANIAQLVAVMKSRFALSASSGSFGCAAAVTTTVPNNFATTTSRIALNPSNAAAGTLQGSAKCLYISARRSGSFDVSTSNGVAAVGTETFDYVLVNTG